MKDFGLDKGARLAADREKKAQEAKQEVGLQPSFPHEVIPPDLEFMDFPANPVPLKKN